MTIFKTEVDPDTGLELKTIGETPGIRIDSVLNGMGVAGGPEVPSPSAEDAQTPPNQAKAEAPAETPEIESGGFMSRVLHVLRGGPEDAMLSPEKRRERESDRSSANQLAASAWKSPGKAFMGPANAGGGDPFESIGKIVRLVSGIL